jgi:hypothetical protein
MRSSRVGGRDLAKSATVLGSIQASSDTVESEGRQMKQCGITYIKIRNKINSPFRISLRLEKNFFSHMYSTQREFCAGLPL